jgi:hypothetical protein
MTVDNDNLVYAAKKARATLTGALADIEQAILKIEQGRLLDARFDLTSATNLANDASLGMRRLNDHIDDTAA